jgi:hypothetical protein
MSDSLRPMAMTSEPARGRERAGGPEMARTQFLAAEAREETSRALERERVLVARLEAVGASARGRLGEAIEEAIERELDARGAAPPGIGSASDADAALSDQLFRARRVGANGIALALGPLRAALSPVGALEPEDGVTLRFWALASLDRPIWLLLDTSDAATGAYREPIPLASVLEDARDERGAEERIDGDSEGESEAAIAASAGDAVPESGADTGPMEPTPTDLIAVAVIAEEPVPSPAPEPLPPTPAPSPIESVAAPPPLPARHFSGASVAAPSDEWRSWVLSLSAARGPQSLAAFERIFSRDYLPLANAISAGLDDTRALAAYEEFRRTFARAYTEACPAFAATGKRPRMVLDAPDVAARIARLHGARSTQILLVDAMRFDVGARVKDGVRRALGARASLTDELVLWSALPTTTLRQLETLQRGTDALSAPAPTPEGERELDPLRGRTAEVIRRVKVGSRDLYKLDVVEARVRDLGDRALPALGEIADLAADAIVRHAQTLQPRTLLFVFGDHGFTFDREGTARQGGASPEEVLVPAFALLLGDVH